MPSDIVLQGIPANGPPGVNVQIDFAQGQAGAPTQVYSALILANCLPNTDGYNATAGTVYGPDTLVPMQTVQDAINHFGAGSPAHLMVAAFKKFNTNTPLYVAPVDQANGTAATLGFTISLSAGQTSGVVQIAIDAKTPAQAVFASSDSASTIASNLAAAVNANTSLPVTASALGAVVTLTAKTIGARGNNLRAVGQVASGAGVAITNTSPAFFSGGSGSDAAGYTSTMNALALNSQRYYYYICEAGWDNIDGFTNQIPEEVQSQIDSMALPAIGIRQRAVFGSNDTLSHALAVSTAINDPRLEAIWCKNLDLTPGELAAQWTAAIMDFETVPLNAGGVNFDGFGADAASQPFWSVRAPLDGTAPSSSDIQSAVVGGLTALRVSRGGTTSVVKRCTSRYFTLGGTGGSQQVLDLRITDAGKVTVCDRIFDDVQAILSLRCARKMIGDNPPAGSPPPGPAIVTTDKVRDICVEVINNYAAAGLINGPASIQGLVVQRNSNPTTTIGILMPVFVADPLHVLNVHGLQLPAILV